jgi:hypothetical protein
MESRHCVAAMFNFFTFKKAVHTVTVTLETVRNKLHIKYKERHKKVNPHPNVFTFVQKPRIFLAYTNKDSRYTKPKAVTGSQLQFRAYD